MSANRDVAFTAKTGFCRRVMNGRRSYGEAYPLPRFRASVLQRNLNAWQGQDAQPGVSVQRISNALLRKPVLFWRIAGTTPFLFHPGHGEWQEKGWAWEKRRKHPFGGLQILEGASVPEGARYVNGVVPFAGPVMDAFLSPW